MFFKDFRSIFFRFFVALSFITLSCVSGATEVSPYYWIGHFGAKDMAIGSLREAQQKWRLRSSIVGFVVGTPQSCELGGSLVRRMNDAAVQKDIATFQKNGGVVTLSFGGQAGVYLEEVCTSSAMLEIVHSLLQQSHVKSLDFDLEGQHLTDQKAQRVRSEVLSQLLSEQKDLKLSFTFPVSPPGPNHSETGGLSKDALKILKDLRAHSISPNRINLLLMNYGPYFSKGRSMSDLSIAATEAAEKQLRSLANESSREKSQFARLGMTLMIGQNDITTEATTRADVAKIGDFANKHQIGLLSYWSLARDQSNFTHAQQSAGDFFEAFDKFNSLKAKSSHGDIAK